MHEYVCVFQVFFYEFMGGVEETFYVLAWMISDQYPKLFNRSIYLELALPKNTDNSPNFMFSKQCSTLSKQNITDR